MGAGREGKAAAAGAGTAGVARSGAIAGVSAVAAVARVATIAAAGLGAALGILRAALGAAANAQRHVLGRNAEHHGCDGEHVEQAAVGQLQVNLLGRGVLLHHEPTAVGVAAARVLARLVEVDGHGVVGQVGVVDAVAADVLALGPLGAQLGHLLQAGGKLVRGGHEHGDGGAVLERDGGARRGRGGVGGCGAGVSRAVGGAGSGCPGCARGCAGRPDFVHAQRGLVAADERVVALRGLKAQRGVEAAPKADGGKPAALRQGVGERGGVPQGRHLAGELLAAQPGEVADAERGHGLGARERTGKLACGDGLHLNVEAGGTKGAADGRGGAGTIVERDDAQALGALGPGLGALVGLGKQPVPGLGVVAEPVVKAPARPQQAGRAVKGRARGLHHELAGTAKGHGQHGGVLAAAAVPGAGREQRGGVVAAQAHEAVVGVAAAGAAVEERLAGKVDAAGGASAAHTHDDGKAGVAHVDAGAAALAVLEAVADGVLGAQGHELRVAQLVVGAVGVDGKGGAQGEVALPLDVVDAVVELVGVGGVDVGEHEGHARGDAAPQADAVGVLERAGEGHLAVQGAHARGTQARKLAGEQLLKALGAGGEELERGAVI